MEWEAKKTSFGHLPTNDDKEKIGQQDLILSNTLLTTHPVRIHDGS